MNRWFLLLTLTASLIAIGCGGKQSRADSTVVEQSTEGDDADLDEVDAAELANSPCGNPDWARLPEGSDAPKTPPN